jgi:hypothetical protein
MSDAMQEGPRHLQQADQDQKVGWLDTAPASAYRTFNRDASNLRDVSLEGLRAFRRFSTFSDKSGSFRAFDTEHLIGAVRITHPHSTLSDLPKMYAPTSAP